MSFWTAPEMPTARAECVAPHRECVVNTSLYQGRCRVCVFANVAPGEVDLFDEYAMGRITAADGQDYWLVDRETYVAKIDAFRVYERGGYRMNEVQLAPAPGEGR